MPLVYTIPFVKKAVRLNRRPRKRSQVAVISQGGEVLATRNVPNGVKSILSVIGGLPAGTPAAGWSHMHPFGSRPRGGQAP